MRQQLRFNCSGDGEFVTQGLSDAAMQDLTPASEQILISSILYERMLETILRFRRKTLGEKDIGLSETLQCRLKRRIRNAGYGANEREKSRPITAPICATSRAGPRRSSRAVNDCCNVGGIV